MDKIFKSSLLAIAVASVIGLSGCGGGGSAGGSQTSSGVITGFGSVFVNGVEFETGGSTFSLDDGDDGLESEDELEVGMVVTVTGTVNADGVSGSATHIEYDDELEGIVESTSIDLDGVGSMVVMGQTVNIDISTIFESEVAGIVTINDVVAGNVVEVSGYSSGDGVIFATRIEVELADHDGEEIEVKGIIANLTATTFTLGDLTVDFSGAVLEDIPIEGLADGMYVEVKSTAGIVEGILIASEVELEDDDDLGGEDGEDVDLSGPITEVLSDTSFRIGGQIVIITEITDFEHGSIGDIVVGAHVQVEGDFNVEGDIVANEIEFGFDSDIEMEGTLEGVSGTGASGTVTLFGQTLIVNTSTIMVDEQDEGVEPVHFFGLDDLVAGVDYIEVDAHRDPDTGDLIADKIERDDDGSDGDELEGPVEALPGEGLLVIAGVTVDVSGILELPVITIDDEVEVNGTYDVGTQVFTATSLEIEGVD